MDERERGGGGGEIPGATKHRKQHETQEEHLCTKIGMREKPAANYYNQVQCYLQ